MRISKKNDWVVDGEFVLELARDEKGKLYDAHTDKELPEFAQSLPITDADWTEIVISFTSRGYYQPGCMYLRNGDPGYPPESGDERTFDEARIEYYELIDDRCKKTKSVKIDQTIGEQLFDHYYDQIMDTELDFPEEPDRDDY